MLANLSDIKSVYNYSKFLKTAIVKEICKIVLSIFLYNHTIYT